MLKQISDWKLFNNTVALFVEECVTKSMDEDVTTSYMYKSYREWCLESGRHYIGKQKFNQQLGEFGFTRYKSGVEKWRDVNVRVN